MKTALAAAALLVLALSGCAGAAAENADTARVAAGSTAAEPEAPTAAASGSILDPDGDFRDEVDLTNLDGSYLESVHRVYRGDASDAELIAEGRAVCEDYEAGRVPVVLDTMASTEADRQAALDRAAVVAAAPFVYCTEYFIAPQPVKF